MMIIPAIHIAQPIAQPIVKHQMNQNGTNTLMIYLKMIITNIIQVKEEG